MNPPWGNAKEGATHFRLKRRMGTTQSPGSGRRRARYEYVHRGGDGFAANEWSLEDLDSAWFDGLEPGRYQLEWRLPGAGPRAVRGAGPEFEWRGGEAEDADDDDELEDEPDEQPQAAPTGIDLRLVDYLDARTRSQVEVERQRIEANAQLERQRAEQQIERERLFFTAQIEAERARQQAALEAERLHHQQALERDREFFARFAGGAGGAMDPDDVAERAVDVLTERARQEADAPNAQSTDSPKPYSQVIVETLGPLAQSLARRGAAALDQEKPNGAASHADSADE